MVKTILSEIDVTEVFSNYNFNKPKLIYPIEAGAVQSNYMCEFDSFKAVLRIYENRTFEEISYEIDILNQLKVKNYPCPYPYEIKNNDYIGKLRDKHFVLYKFIEGEHIITPTEQQKVQLVEEVAKFNIAAKNMRSEYEKYRLNYNTDFCIRLAKGISEKINTPNSNEKYSWYLKEIDKLILPDEMSFGVCHCDFHFTNIMFKDGVVNGLIDFDDCNYTYSIFDLVLLLDPFEYNDFNWDNWHEFNIDTIKFDFTKPKEILKHYMKINPLINIDLAHIYDVLKLTVLIDCLWYFERGDVKAFYERAKIEYLNKIGRDNFCVELDIQTQ